MNNLMVWVCKNRNALVVDKAVYVFEYWHRTGKLMRECVPLFDAYNILRLLEARKSGWKLVGSGVVVEDRGKFVNPPRDWPEHIVGVRWIRTAPTPVNKFRTIRYQWQYWKHIIRFGYFYLIMKMRQRRG